MKLFKKIITLFIIQIFFVSNICFGQQPIPGQETDILSPRIILTNDGLKAIFTPAEEDLNSFKLDFLKEYDPKVCVLDNGELSLMGRVFVEFGIIRHQLAGDLTLVFTALSIVSDRQRIAKADFERIQVMCDDLKRINDTLAYIFEDGKIPRKDEVSDLIMQVNGLRTKYAGLVKLWQKQSLDEDSDDMLSSASILNRGIKTIDFIIEHTDAVLFGPKETRFDILSLFEKEKKFKILELENLTDHKLFGYRSDLDFVIKNLRYNVIDHAVLGLPGNNAKKMPDYYTKITQDDKNFIITYTDTGQGFNIDKLKEKAVELKFWDKKHADSATDEQVIDLIFSRGFSDRYEEGKAHGLGLWLSRMVIENYFKGRIKAKNAKDHSGAVFTITIPRRKAKLNRSFDLVWGILLGIPVVISSICCTPVSVGLAEKPSGDQIFFTTKNRQVPNLEQKIKKILSLSMIQDNQGLIEQAI